MKEIIFLEGLPGVGKTTIINNIQKMKIKGVFTVDELVIDIDDKTPVNQDIFIENDNKKINMYKNGKIIIDRGPISTLSYNEVRSFVDNDFSPLYVEEWFNKIKNVYNNSKIFYLTTNGKEFYLPFENVKDPYGTIENQKLLEETTIKSIKKFSNNYKIIEYDKSNMEALINEIID